MDHGCHINNILSIQYRILNTPYYDKDDTIPMTNLNAFKP